MLVCWNPPQGGAAPAGRSHGRHHQLHSPITRLLVAPNEICAVMCCQVEQHLRAVARPCGIGTAAIVGGLSAVKQVGPKQSMLSIDTCLSVTTV